MRHRSWLGLVALLLLVILAILMVRQFATPPGPTIPEKQDIILLLSANIIFVMILSDLTNGVYFPGRAHILIRNSSKTVFQLKMKVM